AGMAQLGLSLGKIWGKHWSMWTQRDHTATERRSVVSCCKIKDLQCERSAIETWQKRYATRLSRGAPTLGSHKRKLINHNVLCHGVRRGGWPCRGRIGGHRVSPDPALWLSHGWNRLRLPVARDSSLACLGVRHPPCGWRGAQTDTPGFQ